MQINYKFQYKNKPESGSFSTNTMKVGYCTINETIKLVRGWWNHTIKQFNPMLVGDVEIELVDSKSSALIATCGVTPLSPDGRVEFFDIKKAAQ